MLHTETTPATKAGKRMVRGKEIMVNKSLAKTIVKAFPATALTKNI